MDGRTQRAKEPKRAAALNEIEARLPKLRKEAWRLSSRRLLKLIDQIEKHVAIERAALTRGQTLSVTHLPK